MHNALRKLGPIVMSLAAHTVACAPATVHQDEPSWPAPIPGTDLAGHVGQPVVLVGQQATEIWQHLVGGVEGKQAVYFDLADGGQIVVHVVQPFACPGKVAVLGVVRGERGSGKRPTKVDETYVEYSVDVTAWRCQTAAP